MGSSEYIEKTNVNDPDAKFQDVEYTPNRNDGAVRSLLVFGTPSRKVEGGWSSVIFVGAFFQFTPADRYAWNLMLQEGIIPEPGSLLGARWTRITDNLPESAYVNHMPKAKTKLVDGPLDDKHLFKSL